MTTNNTPSEDPTPSELPPVTSRENVDPEIYHAWKTHMIEGYQHNSEMFNQVLDAFMRPYWQTVWMYRLMFWIGVIGFVLAAVLGLILESFEFTAIFGGLTAVSFLTYFLSRPLQSLEQNIMLVTWLGVIYNTYWTRLMCANNPESIQADLKAITKAAVEDLAKLADKHTELSGKRPAIDQKISEQ